MLVFWDIVYYWGNGFENGHLEIVRASPKHFSFHGPEGGGRDSGLKGLGEAPKADTCLQRGGGGGGGLVN